MSLVWAALICAAFQPPSSPAHAGDASRITGEAAYVRQSYGIVSGRQYDALFAQGVPGGAEREIVSYRLFPQVGLGLFDVAFDSSGRYLAFRSAARGVFVYDLKTSALTETAEGVAGFSWSPAGSRLLVENTSGAGDAVSVFNAENGRTARLLPPSSRLGDAQWSANGTRVLYILGGNTVYELNPATGRKTVRWRGKRGETFTIFASLYTRKFLVHDAEDPRHLDGWLDGEYPGSFERTSLDKPLSAGTLSHDDNGSPAVLWSPDRSLVAIHSINYISNVDPETHAVGTPRGADHDILGLRGIHLKPSRELFYWHDAGITPYDCRMVGWSGRGRWLMVLYDEDLDSRLPPTECLEAVETSPAVNSDILTAPQIAQTILRVKGYLEYFAWHADSSSNAE